METNRKLTTILSADVEGYSRLMGVDEEGTFAALKASRDAVARHVSVYDGRVVNTWGDALIAEFPSVVSAVRAAIDAQGELAERNAGKPVERQMLYRVGINLGDVIADGDDIYGDGVNLAARLQAEAPPGGILISSTVYDQVRNKLTVGFEFLGNLDVKNMEEAVPVFSVRIGDDGRPLAAEVELRKAERAPVFGRTASVHASRDGAGEASAAAAAPIPRDAGSGSGNLLHDRKVQLLGIVGAVIVAINLITWSGEFWSVWALFALAVIAGLDWARRTSAIDRVMAGLTVIGATVVAVNLLTWEGRFWAIWPLLGIAAAAAARRVLRRPRK
ncbi:adenylate/guanylate cyclase domain-containing protein [Arvimicrobium flavum]|uniref:adenylate/guanylate cyclase domain-containing protein n=1 Tax=Arvimicrobium flavum TaxID=3393320 RepID=UPI00237AEF34|nr:adenylate/guanylate cyclase domain-containing protein [Mesorhizobium shangrilense]